MCKNLSAGEMENHRCGLILSQDANSNKPEGECSGIEKSENFVQLKNPHIASMREDYLYHLALGTATHDLVEMFSDVKFICIGGSAKRMKDFAYYIMMEMDYKLPTGATLMDITEYSYRYSMYKVGPVLSVNHGIGIPSMGTLLHELIKLMYHAKAKDPIIIRIGTSGGIGVEPGTVVVTDGALDPMLNPHYEVPVLGKIKRRPAVLDKQLMQELKALSQPTDEYKIVLGKTMYADDFYEGQGRTDGAFCEYTESDKMDYLEKLQKAGVVNIEMEAAAFAAITHYAGIKAAIVCATLIDRLKGDQVTTPKPVLEEWQVRPQIIVGRYIKKALLKQG